MHKTAAWPLALMYVGLIVYASLYPFTNWRDAGLAPWTFLSAPIPRYWTGFDVAINVAGYAPLGGLLALSALRTGRARHAVWLPALCGGVVALGMEALQTYLPGRVASKEELKERILKGIAEFNEIPVPFRWKKYDLELV